MVILHGIEFSSIVKNTKKKRYQFCLFFTFTLIQLAQDHSRSIICVEGRIKLYPAESIHLNTPHGRKCGRQFIKQRTKKLFDFLFALGNGGRWSSILPTTADGIGPADRRRRPPRMEYLPVLVWNNVTEGRTSNSVFWKKILCVKQSNAKHNYHICRNKRPGRLIFWSHKKNIPQPIKSQSVLCTPPFENSPIRSPSVLCTPPFEKSPIKSPSVLCTPPFEQSPIRAHRFCVLPPLKHHLFWWELISAKTVRSLDSFTLSCGTKHAST